MNLHVPFNKAACCRNLHIQWPDNVLRICLTGRIPFDAPIGNRLNKGIGEKLMRLSARQQDTADAWTDSAVFILGAF
jgi:hypothetical protein